MADRVKPNWLVHTGAWEWFVESVHDEYGDFDGVLGREVEIAMQEFADLDRYADLEETVDRLVQAAGRTAEFAGENKKSDWGGEKKRVRVRVNKSVKEQFKQYVEQSEQWSGNGLGDALERALLIHAEGGRPARLERKLERVADDAEAMLAEINEESEAGLSAPERTTIRICSELGEQFTDAELTTAVKDHAGQSPDPTDDTVKKYRRFVVERLDYLHHPCADATVWIPREEAERYAPEGAPRVCWWPLERLDETERIERMKYELAYYAAERGGQAKITVSQIRMGAFDSDLSTRKTRELINHLTTQEGFVKRRKDGEMAVAVNVDTARSDGVLSPMLLSEFLSGDAEGAIEPSGAVASGSESMSVFTDGGDWA